MQELAPLNSARPRVDSHEGSLRITLVIALLVHPFAAPEYFDPTIPRIPCSRGIDRGETDGDTKRFETCTDGVRYLVLQGGKKEVHGKGLL